MTNFFISYNHIDLAWARWIAWTLEEARFTTIVQDWDFRQPGNVEQKIGNAIETSERVILVLSPDYFESSFCTGEWTAAHHRDPGNEQGTLLPVRVRECDLPSLLGPISRIDLMSKTETEAKEELLAFTQTVRRKPQIKPMFPMVEPPPFPGTINSDLRSQKQVIAVNRTTGPDFGINEPVDHPLAKPSWFRHKLDRWLSPLHLLLTRKFRLLSEPNESRVLSNILRNQSKEYSEDIKSKTYVEPPVKNVSENTWLLKARRLGFMKQRIKEIVGLSHGGDGHTARVAILSRKSKFVRNMVRRLLRANEPLVLLGDPGVGKSMTLLKAAQLMCERECTKIFPRVCLIVRLGGFRIEGNWETAVWDYVVDSTHVQIRPYLAELVAGKRLAILFDGMDEMSRVHYNEYTAALSDFALNHKDRIKTLFSCRVTDFSPRFRHNRLVVLPFTEKLVRQYLDSQSNKRFLVKVDKQWLTAKDLASKIGGDQLAVQATNPFVLWLLCKYLRQAGKWPKSRVELLGHYIRSIYEDEIVGGSGTGQRSLDMHEGFLVWGRIAFEITNSNSGTDLPVEDLHKMLTPDELVGYKDGLRCKILSKDEATTTIWFAHHRFQEFFAAYYLHNGKGLTAPNWLDKLDSPRWQETLFNLVLMGGGEEALHSLKNSLLRDIAKLKKYKDQMGGAPAADGPKPELSEIERIKITIIETLLSDRVELASRILQQTQHQPSRSRSALLSAFKRSVGWLSDHGNPITQVKLLLAAKIVPEINLWRVARKAIELKVNWVSQQAHIIALATNQKMKPGNEPDSSYLRTLSDDLLLNIASGQFLNRFGYYRRIAASGPTRLRLVVALGLMLTISTLTMSYGLVTVARWAILPALSRTEIWAKTSVIKGLVFWEKKTSRNEQAADETDAAFGAEPFEPRWFRAYVRASEPEFEVLLSSSGQTLDTWWFFAVLNVMMLFGLGYSSQKSPGYKAFAFQGGGYISLISVILLWALWSRCLFNVLVVTYFIILFASALAAMSWILIFLWEFVGFTLFSIVTLSLTGQPLSRSTKDAVPLGTLWDSEFRNSSERTLNLLAIALLPFLLILISLGIEIDWRLTFQRMRLWVDGLPPIPVGMKSAFVLVAAAFVLAVIVRRMPLIRSWIWHIRLRLGREREKVTKTSVREALNGFVMLILLGLGCGGLDLLTKVSWPRAGAYLIGHFGLFQSSPLWVNAALSIIVFAIAAGGVVSLIIIVSEKFRRVISTIEGYVWWISFCVTVALIVLAMWGLSKIDWIAIWDSIAVMFGLFSRFPPLVNGLLSLACYLEAVGCLVALWIAIRKKEEGVKGPLILMWKWSVACVIVALIPFLAWGFVVLLGRLGMGVYSAALTGQLGPILATILAFVLIVAFLILLLDLLDGTSWDVRIRIRSRLDDTPWGRRVWRRARGRDDYWKQFSHLGPKQQMRLIVQMSESDKSDEEVLVQLRSVENWVREEPASSVYWKTRDKMEAIERQKRMG
jgi:hypothetical protein